VSEIDRLKHVLPVTAGVNEGGHLTIGACDTVGLVRQFGTPLFVFCRQTFTTRALSFRQAFAGAKVYYAGKAFLTGEICRLVEAEGLNLDVASEGELRTALSAGFPAERMILHGNNKREIELRLAVDSGIGRVALDNLEEIERTASAARAAGRRQGVFIRVTPGVRPDTHRHIQTGQKDSKFGIGIWSGQAAQAVGRVLAEPALELAGIHVHIGSNIFSYEPLAQTIQIVLEFMAQMAAENGAEIPELNLGGGFGIPYVAEDSEVDLEQLGQEVRERVAEEAAGHSLPVPQLSFEPGRLLAGNAMVTLYSVGTVKRSPGGPTYVAVDGGMADNIRPALYQARYSVLAAGKAEQPHNLTVNLAGMHCESGDVLATGIDLPEDIQRGDVVAVAATGAYGYSMASNYNKQPRPAVVTVEDGEARLMVRRETFDDLIRLEEPI
jgi:diaminopimelate decarboxylase